MFNKIAFFLILAVTVVNCKKDQNPVPRSGDNIWIRDINSDPEYTKLLAPFNAVVLTGGYNRNGILLYRLKVEGTIDDFVAFDRTCTYEADSCATIWSIKTPYYCICKCCNSKFNIIGSYFETGPAKYPLRKYNCEYIDGSIHIY